MATKATTGLTKLSNPNAQLYGESGKINPSNNTPEKRGDVQPATETRTTDARTNTRAATVADVLAEINARESQVLGEAQDNLYAKAVAAGPADKTETPASTGGGNRGGNGGNGGGNGGSGGGTVTYIDDNGEAQKGTTPETETAEEAQKTYLDELREQYQKMYDDAVAANNAAATAATERTNAQIEQNVSDLGTQYGTLNKQLYRDYMESLRTLPQVLAAQGYSGGMSESSRLGLDTAYGERLNENEASRIAAEAELRQQAADAEYQTNAARDEANATAQQNLYANLINALLQQQQEESSRAENMAQYGDFSGYKNLGYTDEQIAQMQKAWIAANPALARTLGYVKTSAGRSYSGGGGNTQEPEKSVLDEVDEANAAGLDRVSIWNALAADYKAGNITQDEFNDAVKYTDYTATASAFGKTVTQTDWRNSKK